MKSLEKKCCTLNKNVIAENVTGIAPMRELQASIVNSCLPRQMAGKTNSGFEDEKGGGGGLLGVDNSALNSHTYVYDADKSLRKMTIEALPSPENYQVSRRSLT